MAFRIINERLNGTGKVGDGRDKGGDALPVNLVPSFLHLNPPLLQLDHFTMPFLLLLLATPKSSCQHRCTLHYAWTKALNFPTFWFRLIVIIMLIVLSSWWFWSLYNHTCCTITKSVTSLQGFIIRTTHKFHEMIHMLEIKDELNK